MSFKKKQLLGFGLILMFMLILLTSILFMLNTLKSNMLEIVQDRYYKVKSVTEIRQLFYQLDREMLIVLNTNDKKQVNDSVALIEKEHSQIQDQIYSLLPILNRTESKVMLSKIQAEHADYIQTEKKILENLNQGKRNEAFQQLLSDQKEKRSAFIITINEFKDYQESLMKDALKSSSNTYTQVLTFLTIAALLAVIAIAFTAYWVIKSTTTNLKNISDVMKSVDFNKLTSLPRVDVSTNDEIGDIALAFNEMAHSLEVYNQKEKEFTAKIEDQNWMQTRLAEMATMYQRIVDLEVLATRFISKLAPMMDASFGVFYIKMNQSSQTRFRKVASFAGNGKNVGRLEFLPGEGLIGQSVLEKRAHILEEIPENYTLVTSGLGEVLPKSILIAPVLFEGEVIAMVELASLKQFSDLQKAFLVQALDTLGITINSVNGRMEIERLLKESQAQSEELQVQSEELQTQSEELQAQTEEMQAQSEELRMINEQLEERNREAELKTLELEKTKVHLEKQAIQLKQSSKYKSEFLANMSHELRTPLNSILILSEMLSDTNEESLSKEQQEFARVINSSGQDLLSLINDILDLSKVEVGKLDMVFGEMNLSELPGLIERNFSHHAKNKGIEFTIEKEDDAPEIFYTDEQRLQQIIKNLLSNAFKFTDSGSVKVKFAKASREDITTLHPHDGENSWLAISVTDTGIGIPKDKQELIFEAFQQVDGATMRKYGGTGLGLSICKEFSRLLGGYLLLDSEEGKGSTFTLYIPNLPSGIINQPETIIASKEVAAGIINDEVEKEYETGPEEISALQTLVFDSHKNLLRNKKVLVVDDDNRNIFALQNALAKEGMEILTAQNGTECLALLDKVDDIDIVLMDIMMPVMDGYETMRRIRMNHKFDQLPIVALTAKAMKGDREKCLEAGASDYISKPLKMDQLLSVLRVWLSSQAQG